MQFAGMPAIFTYADDIFENSGLNNSEFVNS